MNFHADTRFGIEFAHSKKIISNLTRNFHEKIMKEIAIFERASLRSELLTDCEQQTF